MKNKIGIISGFMISSFVHFGILLFAFLFLKEQAPIKKELFHTISLSDYIAQEQSIAQNKQMSEPIKQKQVEPTKVEPKTQNIAPKPMPKKIEKSNNLKKSQVLENSKSQQISQNNTTATKENLAKNLAKEQDEIASQIYKILLAYINKNYPKDALRHNQSGSVIVSFNYNSSGVSNAEILQSSNIKSLDNASLKAIEKTKHLFPKTDKNFVFKLPVRFAIK